MIRKLLLAVPLGILALSISPVYADSHEEEKKPDTQLIADSHEEEKKPDTQLIADSHEEKKSDTQLI